MRISPQLKESEQRRRAHRGCLRGARTASRRIATAKAADATRRSRCGTETPKLGRCVDACSVGSDGVTGSSEVTTAAAAAAPNALHPTGRRTGGAGCCRGDACRGDATYSLKSVTLDTAGAEARTSSCRQTT